MILTIISFILGAGIVGAFVYERVRRRRDPGFRVDATRAWRSGEKIVGGTIMSGAALLIVLSYIFWTCVVMAVLLGLAALFLGL
jgi:hypothetical protein